MPKQLPKSSVRVFCCIFILAGLVSAGVGVWNLIRSVRCESWPTTQGVIKQSKMVYHSGKHGGTYSAEVAYDYDVDGVPYYSTRLAFGTMSASSAYARGVLNRYPIGKKVPVHYSPDDPEESLLEPGIHGGTWICLFVGTSFVLAGVMFFQISNRSGQTAPSFGRPVITQSPPILAGVIFMAIGFFTVFMRSSSEGPRLLVYVVGGVFISAGLFLLVYRLRTKL